MKTPFISREDLEMIVSEFPTPFHLYDEKGIREKARAVNKAFSWNEGFKEYFAVKATPEVPCPVPFSFTFGENELKEYYKEWEFLEYNENMGELHKTDENGNRYKMKFVTMLARKK